MTYTGGQSASAKREQNCVDAVEPVEELEADGARPFAGIEIFAVFHEKRITVGCDLPGTLSRILDVSLDQFDGRAQSTNPIDLPGIGAFARYHCDADAARPAAISERLPEIAGTGTDGDLGTWASCET